MNRAKQLRLDRGLTISDVAQATKVGRRTIRVLEDGQEVQAPSLARLSTFYECSASELLAPAHFETPRGRAA
jgi:transcriptional regulator with XRE-family HTH domain